METKNSKGILSTLTCVVADATGKSTYNGTKYTREFWNSVLKDSNLISLLKNHTLFGELDHPDADESSETSLVNTAISFTDLSIDGDEVKGTFNILDTPSGKIVQNLVDAGCNIGLSLRGRGSKGYDGTVSPTGYKLYGIDVVSNPSYQDSRLIGTINESAKSSIRNEEAIYESVKSQIKLADNDKYLSNLATVINRVKLNEMSKDELKADLNEKSEVISSVATNSEENIEFKLNEAILSSVLKEVNILNAQLADSKAECEQLRTKLDESTTVEELQLRGNVVIEESKLNELKNYAVLLEGEVESYSTKLEETTAYQSKLVAEKDAELEKAIQENAELGVKVGELADLVKTNKELNTKVATLSQQANDLSEANEKLLKKYAKQKQYDNGIVVNENYTTVEQFDKLYEQAKDQDMLVNSSRHRSGFNSLNIDEIEYIGNKNLNESEHSLLYEIAKSIK